MQSPEFLDARALRCLMASGKLRAEELVQACQARIAEREPAVRAWVALAGEAAIAQARALDELRNSGPLHGIPVGVKDIVDTAGLGTSYGSPIHAHHQPALDASIVAILRKAGAIVLGKTVTAEFASHYPGPTCNPLDLRRTPGGSSSGSAAAVADHMVPLAVGTQTTASIVRPAAFCGVVGMQPTHGLLPVAGIKPNSPSFDTVGVFSRTVDDAALLLDVLAERAPSEVPDIQPPRLGVCRTPFWTSVDRSVAAAFEEAIDRLAKAGAQLEIFDFPLPAEATAKAHGTISARELAASLAGERAFHFEEISADLREGKIAKGVAVTDLEYVEAQRLLERARLVMDEAWRGCDAWIAPSAGTVAPIGLNSTGSPLFCTLWTALHLPALSLPAPSRVDGMPVGLQFVAARGTDRRLLECARWAERAFRGGKQ